MAVFKLKDAYPHKKVIVIFMFYYKERLNKHGELFQTNGNCCDTMKLRVNTRSFGTKI